MPQEKTPGPARAAGAEGSKRTPKFPSPGSIRRRYGANWPGYESAKAAWLAANPDANNQQIEQAARRIARAMRL